MRLELLNLFKNFLPRTNKVKAATTLKLITDFILNKSKLEINYFCTT